MHVMASIPLPLCFSLDKRTISKLKVTVRKYTRKVCREAKTEPRFSGARAQKLVCAQPNPDHCKERRHGKCKSPSSISLTSGSLHPSHYRCCTEGHRQHRGNGERRQRRRSRERNGHGCGRGTWPDDHYDEQSRRRICGQPAACGAL